MITSSKARDFCSGAESAQRGAISSDVVRYESNACEVFYTRRRTTEYGCLYGNEIIPHARKHGDD